MEVYFILNTVRNVIMGKTLFIAEKPSVAMDFVKLLKVNGRRNNGYIEGDNSIFTWCVGHMVTMSYPEAYNEKS